MGKGLYSKYLNGTVVSISSLMLTFYLIVSIFLNSSFLLTADWWFNLKSWELKFKFWTWLGQRRNLIFNPKRFQMSSAVKTSNFVMTRDTMNQFSSLNWKTFVQEKSISSGNYLFVLLVFHHGDNSHIHDPWVNNPVLS